MDEILEQARAIGADPKQGWDAAALYLGTYRRDLAAGDLTDPKRLNELIEVLTLQLEALRKANKSDKAVEVGTWFHHVLHDLPSAQKGQKSREIVRETLSHFFCEYARNLCVLERYEEMRLAMRTALDSTRVLPFVIVSLIHLYAPLINKDQIEGEPARIWLTKRYCECLALLDFAGFAQTPFRASLDDFQAAVRDEAHRDTLYNAVKARNDQTDPALDTLTKLFESQFCISPKSP